ncbi:MAG: ATP-binding protein [Blastomonas sp.]
MPNHPARPFRSGRFLVAIGLLAAGAGVSQFWKGPGEQAAIVFLFGLIAIIAMIDLAAPAAQNPQAAAPIRQGETPPIGRHPDFLRLIDGLADPVMLLDGNKVRNANIAARKLLGDHIGGEDIRLVIRHPAAADILTQPDSGIAQRPVPLVGIGSRDQRWEMQVRAMPGNERLVYLWDRSGQHAIERMRTDFVANASHELRTPLASIKGFIETLEDEEAGSDAETRKRFLGVMFREANRMQKLIDDLISLSRIEADKFRLPDTPVDLPELMREVQAIFRQNEGARGQDVILDIAENTPPLNGDRTQLSQLLHNLVSNSLKYGQAGTPVTMSLRPSRTGAMVRLSVTDVGEGIAPEHLPRLTERFYRVDSSRSRAIGGTGLGLSIVKHIVERHRGRLHIESTPGKGTEISITLPAATGTPAPPMAAETAGVQSDGQPAS